MEFRDDKSYGVGHLVTATFGQWPIWPDEVKFFQKKNSLKICVVGLFIDQKEVFLHTKVNFGPKFVLTIVDIH